MNLRMAAILEEHPDTLAFVHGGDYCQRAEWRYLDRWLTDHELTATESGPIAADRSHTRQSRPADRVRRDVFLAGS
jgi:hypothetical protein